MYPIALICFSPLSGDHLASFPHELLLSGCPPVPNPILELQELQSFSLLPIIPILALDWRGSPPTALNPSLLQLSCKEASEPISDFHVSRPSKGVAVLPISDQRVQGVRLLVDDNKLDRLLTDLHTEADLREGCVPVGGKFCLLWVKPSLPSVKVKGFFVAPESGTVVKSLLWEKQVLGRQIN